MFRSHQIITATKLLKNFTQIIKEMKLEQQAILITTKSDYRFVLLNAELYDELLNTKLEYFQDFKS